MKKKLIKTNELSKDVKNTLLKRSLIAIVLVLVLIPCVILGGYFYFAVIALLVLASIYEILKTPQHKFAWFIWLVAYITIIALVFWVMLKSQLAVQFKNFDINFAFNQIWISPIALAVMIGLYFFFVVMYANFSIQDAFYLISLSILVALGYQALLFIRYIPFTYFKAVSVDTTSNLFKYGQSMFLVFYMIVAIFMNDIGAYITGILIGKHKINPRISPKKTWEGFFGGIFFSIAFSLMFALLVAHYGLPMLPNFDVAHWYWILLCSAILPIIGNLGDFAFSSIKRHYNIKDYSNVLGPHGGVLDRFDSSLFGAIALAILVIFISNGWNFYL